MKIRSGFVSNSSSSSFVLVVSKEKWDEAYNKLHPYIKAHVDFLGRYGTKKEGTFNNTDVVMFGYPDGNCSPYEYDNPKYDGEIPEQYEDHWESVYEFKKKLQEGEHLSASFDM